VSAIFTNSAYLLSGLSAYAFLTHIQVGLRRPKSTKHTLFAFMCLFVSLSAPFNALTNSASAIPEYIFATKAGYTFVFLFLICMTWFIPCYTNRKPFYFLITSNICFLVMLVINLIRPYGFQFDLITDLKIVPLPWGESYVLAVGEISLIYKFTVLVFLILMCHMIYALVMLVRKNLSSNNVAILLGTIFFFSSYVEAILARSGVINFLPLGTFGGLGLIIVMSVILNKEDSDERTAAAAAISKEHQKLETILKTAHDGIYIVDKDGLLIQANDAFLDMLQLDKSNIGARIISDWNPEYENSNLKKRLEAILQNNEKIVIETQHLRTDGKLLDVEVSINPVDIDGGRFLFCASRNISERKLFHKELEQKAHIDYLTGLHNRGYFMTQAAQELAKALRYKNKMSLFMLDIDNFKKVNDAYGHKIGDLALKKLAEIFKATLRSVDIVGRIGGEEFAVLLPETDIDNALEVAERLRKNFAESAVNIGTDLSIHVTVSIGVSELDHDTNNLETLLHMADSALYEAKNNGRNRVVAHKR